MSNFCGMALHVTPCDATHLYAVCRNSPRVLEATGGVFQRSYRIVPLSFPFPKEPQTPGVIAMVTVGDINPAEKVVQP